MTNLDATPDDDLPVLETSERRTAVERIQGRTCAWCSAWIPYLGSGRPPKYCTQSCRQRAYELRSAGTRADRDLAAGRRRDEPVRELVERVETVVKTVVRQAPPEVVTRTVTVPAKAPAAVPAVPKTARQWLTALTDLYSRLDHGELELVDDPLWPTVERALREVVSVADFSPAYTVPPVRNPVPPVQPALPGLPQESRQVRRARERADRKKRH